MVGHMARGMLRTFHEPALSESLTLRPRDHGALHRLPPPQLLDLGCPLLCCHYNVKSVKCVGPPAPNL